jgi:hypothetical protein
LHPTPRSRRFRRKGWITLAAILGAVLVFLGIGAAMTLLAPGRGSRYPSAVGTPVFVPSPSPTSRSTTGVAQPAAPAPPISGTPSTGAPPQLPKDAGLIFTSQDAIYLLTPASGTPELLHTPGYLPGIPPSLTSDGHLLYAGDGLYLADLLHRDSTAPLQIASIDPTAQIIASASSSPDGQHFYWSVEPRSGAGTITFYTATITPAVGDVGPNAGIATQTVSAPQIIYTQPADACPCYMLFGPAPGDAAGPTTLLFTDDLDAPGEQGTGLWPFDLASGQIGTALLPGSQGHIPLTLSPDRTLLAYALTSGVVPEPTDNSVPPQIGGEPYGDSLTVAPWNINDLGAPLTIVSPQSNAPTLSAYHWIATPFFSPDARALAYIQFSADDVGPYDRHSTLYLAPTDGSAAPTIIATFSARMVELGGWLDGHTLLFYADNGLYALDIHTAAYSLLGAVSDYSTILGIMRGLPSGEAHLPGAGVRGDSQAAASPAATSPTGRVSPGQPPLPRSLLALLLTLALQTAILSHINRLLVRPREVIS